MLIFSVAAGGALGAVLRFLTTNLISAPYGTLTVNIIGSGMLGILYAYTSQLNPTLETAIRAGILGAFTTFSAFALDSVMLIEQGRILASLLYIMLSVLLSLAAFALFYFWLR